MPVAPASAVSFGCLALLLGTVGCTGLIGGPETQQPSPGNGTGGGSTGGGTASDDRVAQRVWRLSPLHYNLEVQRLFPGAPSTDVPVSAPENGFTDIAANARIDIGNVSLFADAARAVARHVTSNGSQATRCASYGTSACADELLGWLPAAAFRRPLTDAEATKLRGLFDGLAADFDFDFAVSGLVQAVLLSPQFLYRTELGATGTTLTDYEIASLMAFGITDRAPDSELLAAAAAGRLRDSAERERQARRLMADSAPMWQRFFWEWLHMSTLDSQGQEVGLDANVVRQIREEYETFVANIVVRDRGTLRTLLNSTRTWIGPELAALYGVAHPGGGQAEVDLNPGQRSGLLTLGAWLVSHGKRGRANVVRRGMGIYVDAMCNAISPPPGLDLEAETERLVGANATVKEIVDARGQDAVCGACHRVADPVGLAFETFASTGAWQESYADGAPVQPAVTVDGVGDFANAVGLSRALANDERFQRCLVRRLQHYLVGVDLGRQRWTEEALATFQAEDTSFEELLVDLVSDPAFIERTQ